MKKVIFNIKSCLLLMAVVLVAFSQSGCNKNDSGSAPSITSVRNYVPSPGDSLLSSVGPGQWVVIEGQNLKGALQILFDGVPASFNEAIFSPTSAVVLLPAVISFPSVPTEQLNTIRYVTTYGETTFSFPILPPAPTITAVSNENANVGDSVTIYGLNFFFLESVNFAGVAIPASQLSGAINGTAVTLKIPASVTGSGIVTVTTSAGSASTLYNVNDLATGMLTNFDDINAFSWGSNIENDPAYFPGNKAKYARMAFAKCSAYQWDWWNGGRSLNFNEMQWVPAANVGDSTSKWALKFEMYIKNEWADGTIFIHDGGWGRTARFEPWKAAAKPVVTTGWTTFTLPLTTFRSKVNGVDGTGDFAATVKDLIGDSGKKPMTFAFANPSADVLNFDAAVDNVRIVRIAE